MALSSRAATLVAHTPTLPGRLGCTAGQAADTRNENRTAWGTHVAQIHVEVPLPWKRTAPARVSRTWPALPEVLAEGRPGRRRPRPLSRSPATSSLSATEGPAVIELRPLSVN